MNQKVKVVFIGGFAYGKVIYDYLASNKYVNVSLCITYPDCNDKEDMLKFPDADHMIRDVSANKYIDRIREIEPDFIFVSGWSELLDHNLLNLSKKGSIGFHPSRLPRDRGRSVLAWQIEENYTNTALSMFYLNDMPDCGDIIAQEEIKIDFQDNVKDVLLKVADATFNIMKAYFPLLREGKAPRIPQDMNQGNFRRLRTNRDSEINWNTNSLSIYNKIRAITRPYPGATALIENKRYKIWKCVITDFHFGLEMEPGTLIATLFDKSLILKTRDGFVRLIEYDRINSTTD